MYRFSLFINSGMIKKIYYKFIIKENNVYLHAKGGQLQPEIVAKIKEHTLEETLHHLIQYERTAVSIITLLFEKYEPNDQYELLSSLLPTLTLNQKETEKIEEIVETARGIVRDNVDFEPDDVTFVRYIVAYKISQLFLNNMGLLVLFLRELHKVHPKFNIPNIAQTQLILVLDNLKLVEYYKTNYGFSESKISDGRSVRMVSSVFTIIKKCGAIGNVFGVKKSKRRNRTKKRYSNYKKCI
jgi:hypothetical protein